MRNIERRIKVHLWFAIAYSIVVISGESIRSFGAGRPLVAWVDDFIGCGLLLVAAILIFRNGTRFWPVICCGWGIMFGLVYGSFFSKYYSVEKQDPGNIPFETLLFLIGIGFVITTVGLVWSLYLIAIEER